MSTLTLDDVKQANDIFDRIYETFRLRKALFNFKLKRSPEMRMFKSVRHYEESLSKLSEDDIFCDLWNQFTCVELGDELRENTLKKRDFIAHCKRLLDGSHEIFQFSQPLSTHIGVDDVRLLKVVAEKLVEEIVQWKYQAIAMTRTDFWQFDFCIADICCVIEKCQAVLNLDEYVESVTTVAQPLLHEWWETIEKHHANAKYLHDSYFSS